MPDPVAQMLADISVMTADYVALVANPQGVTEPDGVALSFGVQVPNDPSLLGYGTDWSCGFIGDGTGDMDIDDNASEVDPNSTTAVEQALARRLSTPNGQILGDGSPEDVADLIAVGEDPDYGFNIVQMLGVGFEPSKLQAYQDLAAAECLKDDRVASCSVTLRLIGENKMTILVTGELYTGRAYKLVMPINSTALATVLNA